jgi:hypothetical protein
MCRKRPSDTHKLIRAELRAYVEKNVSLKQPERIALQGRRLALQRAIVQWAAAQSEYMPHISWARSSNDFTFAAIRGTPLNPTTNYFTAADPISTTSPPAPLPGFPQPPPPKNIAISNDLMDVDSIENVKLWLPSDVPPHVRHLVCSEAACRLELMLAKAELHDALIAVRKYRRAFCIIRAYYMGALSSKAPKMATTRRVGKIISAGLRINDYMLRYQRAWVRANALDPTGTWHLTYRYLEKSDIRGPNPGDDETDLAAVGRARPRDAGIGRYLQSWIWTNLSANDEPVDQVSPLAHSLFGSSKTRIFTGSCSMGKDERCCRPLGGRACAGSRGDAQDASGLRMAGTSPFQDGCLCRELIIASV